MSTSNDLFNEFFNWKLYLFTFLAYLVCFICNCYGQYYYKVTQTVVPTYIAWTLLNNRLFAWCSICGNAQIGIQSPEHGLHASLLKH